MRVARLSLAGLLLALVLAQPAAAGGIQAYPSPYRPDSPVWGSPYRGGPVLGGIFYDGRIDDRPGGAIFSPARGVTCDLRRHACWTPVGIDRRWTARYFGIRS